MNRDFVNIAYLKARRKCADCVFYKYLMPKGTFTEYEILKL